MDLGTAKKPSKKSAAIDCNSPQLNGIAERINRTIVKKVRCMLRDAKLPSSFWGEAIKSAVDLINLSPLVFL